MKTMLIILSLAGATLLVSAGEPVKTDKPSAPASGAVTNNTQTGQARLSAEDNAAIQGLGERLANSGAITVKPLRSTGRGALELFNPFTPLEPTPGTPWLSRAPWNVAGEKALANPVPIEVRHESHFGLSIASL